MTKATKLTPSLAWALVVFNNVRVEESYPLDGLLLYEGARAFIFERRFTDGLVISNDKERYELVEPSRKWPPSAGLADF